MSFDLVGNAANGGSTNSVTVDKPTGTQEGDIMFALATRGDNKAEPNSTPSGWTRLAYKQGVWDYYGLYYKVAGASEPSDYTWGWSSSSKVTVVVAAYRGGFDGADPIDTYSSTAYTSGDNICRAASVTVSSDDSPLLWVAGACVSTSFSLPNGFTEDADSTFKAQAGAIGHKVVDAGATGNLDGTFGTVSTYKHAFAVALNPLLPTNKRSQFLLLDRDYPVEVREYPVLP